MSDTQINAFVAAVSSPVYRDLVQPHATPVELRAGQYLHHSGQTLERVVFPHSGVVALTWTQPHLATGVDAHGVVAAILGRDSVIGAAEAVAAVPATCNAEVLVSGQASTINAVTFRYLLDGNAAIRQLTAQFISAMMAHVEEMAHCHAKHSVEARLCRLLCEISDLSGRNKVALMQDTLANMLGVRRTSINFAVRHLATAGLLRSGRGNLKLLKRDELGRRSCSCGIERKDDAAAPPFDHMSEAGQGLAPDLVPVAGI